MRCLGLGRVYSLGAQARGLLAKGLPNLLLSRYYQWQPFSTITVYPSPFNLPPVSHAIKNGQYEQG